LTLSTTDEVQGLVAVFEWDGARGTGVDLTEGAGIAGADVVSTRVEADYMVLGVVMDTSDAPTPQVIGPGNNIVIATAVIQCGQQEGSTPVNFSADQTHSMVDGGPLLDTIVVVGGLSIGRPSLGLSPGSFECARGANRYYLQQPADANEEDDLCAASVMMENTSAVEGYVVALCHPTGLTLTSIGVGSAATAQGADFSDADLFATGGTLGVVIDLVAPFTNNTIPPGDANQIAVYNYRFAGGPGTFTFPLTFCDGQLGSPVKENVVVIGGLSVSPALENGSITCTQIEVPPPEVAQMFACGSRSAPGTVEASEGGATEVCFYIKSPEDNSSGHAQFDHIQGFSMALTFCCNVAAREALDIGGTIVEAIGAEFVSIQADNDPQDGDGCELVIGVLVDALPPFEGQTIPPLPDFQRVGCVTFDVKPDVACGSMCDVKFTDGVNGRGKVPIKNLISVENESKSPQLMDCAITIVGEEKFHRGDCNFSDMGSMAVDIADAAAVVSFLFLPGTWKFHPPCLDACDCNDDGRLDLADAVCILQYLFQGGRTPPLPGTGWDPDAMMEIPPGPDPTDDKLDCDAGRACD
jgi:hypothetical protein